MILQLVNGFREMIRVRMWMGTGGQEPRRIGAGDNSQKGTGGNRGGTGGRRRLPPCPHPLELDLQD